MAYIEGHARDQALLLPASVEDYVAADSPVRFIDPFVDDLDLGEAGFCRSRPKATGRPGYDPGDMLKLYLYGYLNRVRSSRRLEAEATRNLELIWLLRGLRPDYKTIADFRRDNRGAFKAVFRAFAGVGQACIARIKSSKDWVLQATSKGGIGPEGKCFRRADFLVSREQQVQPHFNLTSVVTGRDPARRRQGDVIGNRTLYAFQRILA